MANEEQDDNLMANPSDYDETVDQENSYEETSADEGEKFEYKTSDETPAEAEERKKALGDKYNADDKELVIKEVSFSNVKNKNLETGELILPNATSSGNSFFYPIKLKVLFEDGDKNLVEYYSGVKVWADKDGNIQKDKHGNVTPAIPRPSFSESSTAKLFGLFCEVKKLDDREISDKHFLTGLVGMKAKLKVSKGKFAGNEWFRNDIVSLS